jgi:hypothetical protein
MTRVFVSVPPELVALMSMLKVPALEKIPLMTPVFVSIFSVVGRPLAA